MSFPEDIYESNYNNYEDFELWIPEGSSKKNLENIDELPQTDRSDKGFGSTGIQL